MTTTSVYIPSFTLVYENSSFTLVYENRQKKYDVSVVDLREGNVRWKKLYPFPFSDGQVMLSFSSFDGDGHCTRYNMVLAENPNEDLSVWTLHGRNNITEWKPELGGSPHLIDRLIGIH
jgi:hypothetical protein